MSFVSVLLWSTGITLRIKRNAGCFFCLLSVLRLLPCTSPTLDHLLRFSLCIDINVSFPTVIFFFLINFPTVIGFILRKVSSSRSYKIHVLFSCKKTLHLINSIVEELSHDLFCYFVQGSGMVLSTYLLITFLRLHPRSSF